MNLRNNNMENKGDVQRLSGQLSDDFTFKGSAEGEVGKGNEINCLRCKIDSLPCPAYYTNLNVRSLRLHARELDVTLSLSAAKTRCWLVFQHPKHVEWLQFLSRKKALLGDYISNRLHALRTMYQIDLIYLI